MTHISMFSASHLLSALTCTGAGHPKYVVRYVLAAQDQHMSIIGSALKAAANRSTPLIYLLQSAVSTSDRITHFSRPHIMSGMFSLLLNFFTLNLFDPRWSPSANQKPFCCWSSFCITADEGQG